MYKQLAFFRKHEINEVKRFIKQQNNALGYGSITKLSHCRSPTPCRGCQQLIDLGSPCIYMTRSDDYTNLWHPQCFTCTQCKEFLVDLMYFYNDGQLYCEQHHVDLYKPRYTNCDQIMFSFECIKTDDPSWNHYLCSNCNERLNGERYVMRNNQAFCLNGFETMYVNYCDTCCEHIEINQTHITRESHQWHTTETCFCCYTCRIPLNNNNNNDFLQDDGALFCSNECASQINNHPIDTQLILQNIIRQHPKPPAFVQHQTLSDFILSKEQKRQNDRHCVTLELPHCSTSSFTLLPYFTNCLRSFQSNGVMSLISHPKSIITLQFPCSSSLNELSRFIQRHCVHFVNDDNQDANETNIPHQKIKKTTKLNKKNSKEERKKGGIFVDNIFLILSNVRLIVKFYIRPLLVLTQRRLIRATVARPIYAKHTCSVRRSRHLICTLTTYSERKVTCNMNNIENKN
ncbi:unnamed protein product [Adineta steineri]|uniref:LIM zinc-binding domain-containing protein n=1 Tax=Adineta steineri TaxID=433720 RepID=A0A813TL12_9BILA|nr:unnamed protein product [Adineta steineri]CAF0821170.1 unnamed protein product [Adineta steineri]